MQQPTSTLQCLGRRRWPHSSWNLGRAHTPIQPVVVLYPQVITPHAFKRKPFSYFATGEQKLGILPYNTWKRLSESGDSCSLEEIGLQ